LSTKRSKRRRLEAAVARVHRRHGTQSLVRGKPPTAIGTATAIPHISTGFLPLDQALGIGGLPKGRVSELVGPATSGKTTLALKFLAQAQKGGGQVAYVDQARAFDPDYAHRCGLDLSRLLVVAPYDLLEALAMTEALAGSGGLEAVVFDGLDAIWGDAVSASLLAACLDRLAAPLARSGTVLLFLHGLALGKSPALSALAHHATVRLHIVRERWLRSHGDIRGYEARVEVLKNRLGPAGRTMSITIEFNGTVRGNGL
jgi:recombination protein RecA